MALVQKMEFRHNQPTQLPNTNSMLHARLLPTTTWLPHSTYQKQVSTASKMAENVGRLSSIVTKAGGNVSVKAKLRETLYNDS